MSAPVALDSALLPQDGFHFLTTVNAREEGEQNERRLLVFEDTKSGGRIQELYGKLTELVGTLDKQVEVLLQDHEDDFFLAYKSHMHSVQNDFKALKKRADEEESKSRRDKKIQSLENELEWFTSEALRLDNVCKNYKKDVDKYRAQAQALEDDRKFLEEQIKACKRQNKLLRSAIEDSNSSANPVSPLSSVSRNFPGVLSSTEPATGSSQSTAIVLATSISGGASSLPTGPRAAANLNRNLTAGDKQAPVTHHNTAHTSVAPEIEERYQKTITRLKLQLRNRQDANRRLMFDRGQQYMKRTDLEDFFLKCVDDVRKDIVRRRFRTASAKATAPWRANGEAPPSPDASSEDVDTVNLEKFTAADRRRVMELLLTESVVQDLYQRLFPDQSNTLAKLHEGTDSSTRIGIQ
eukprot:GHVT01032956.1.p1 GENE.GHVT01032956.1~~GHVT01032956.1.p1  ORF type:complete len:409 (-),score=34.84 GHVT01032956.1:195-1421(-)